MVQAQIILEEPQKTWTNLDVLRGRVRVVVHTPTPIASITVKLEGEARSKLKIFPGSNGDQLAYEKPIAREETHKILYRTLTVLPDPSNPFSAARNFELLPVGTFEYPFSFKVVRRN